ncbi:SDR family oxidoreductase [Candidatus Roizmanbacteria bacterium]|nr:SDR family oxidoreductase [Candidatus Roizmanbacteria bacterium]
MIIITGASDGLGKELSRLFVAANKRVIGLSRNECIPGVEHLKTDLRNEESIIAAADEINAMSDPIEVLINGAGVLSIQKLSELTSAQIDAVLDINIRAPLLLTSQLIEKIKKDGGDIVNIASTVGLKGYSEQAAYGASKWAMRGFTTNLQVELKNSPCRVIGVCPGGFKSKLFEKATGIDNTKEGDWMSAGDIAHCIKQLIDLPKNMEVSEIVINRKISKSL